VINVHNLPDNVLVGVLRLVVPEQEDRLLGQEVVRAVAVHRLIVPHRVGQEHRQLVLVERREADLLLADLDSPLVLYIKGAQLLAGGLDLLDQAGLGLLCVLDADQKLGPLLDQLTDL
jgi:hypothetical protein